MKWTNYFLSGVVAFLVLAGTLLNMKVVFSGVKSKGAELTALPLRIHLLLSEGFSFKNSFLTLNGGYARVLCMRRCNDVYKLPNGHLIRPFPRSDQKWRAEKIASLSRLTSENGSRFVFALLPNKIVNGGRMMPDGWAPGKDALYDNADELLEQLRKLDVDLIDTRKAVCATEDDVLRHFFRTDHHWNALGAFCGFRFLTRELVSRIKGTEDLLATVQGLDLENWDSCGLNRRHKVFLGSNGRRTGPWFAGYDTDYVYLVPKFAQSFEHSYRSRGWHKTAVKRGSFSDTMIVQKVVGECESCYKDGAYSIYYTDLAESIRHCKDAPVNARVLIIKDSYAIPVLAFMSTVFSDIFAVDLRYEPHQSIGDLIKEFHPDIVVMMYNPSSFLSASNKLWNW